MERNGMLVATGLVVGIVCCRSSPLVPSLVRFLDGKSHLYFSRLTLDLILEDVELCVWALLRCLKASSIMGTAQRGALGEQAEGSRRNTLDH